jgi:DNA gyrase subunit B
MEQKDEIVLYTACEAIRRWPDLYFGDLTHGLQRLVDDLIESTVKPEYSNDCTALQVRLHADSSISIVDDGRGINVGPQFPRGDKTPVIEAVLTSRFSGGPDYATCRIYSYLFNLGMVINALSEWLTIETTRDGVKYVIHCAKGEITQPLRALGPSEIPGTCIHFMPDREIWQKITIDPEALILSLERLSKSNPDQVITLFDERAGITCSFGEKHR